MTRDEAIKRALSLPCWTDPGSASALGGGITNHNIRLVDQGRAYVVRVGDDIPAHQVMRFNELACHRAAQKVGLSPAVVYAGQGAMAMEFVTGRTLSETDICQPDTLPRIVPLLRKLHHDGARALRGPVLTFWVFHVVRDYAARLVDEGTPHASDMPDLLATNETLEQAVGPVEMVLGHNDLLPANFIDAGDRIWLLDWDYGGFNSPLFDLAGLASNAGLSSDQEYTMIETYFDRPMTAELARRYAAMKCASLLRETMWSMVSETHSHIDFDYPAYTAKNRARFNSALNDFRNL